MESNFYPLFLPFHIFLSLISFNYLIFFLLFEDNVSFIVWARHYTVSQMLFSATVTKIERKKKQVFIYKKDKSVSTDSDKHEQAYCC